ncbi:MAG: ABC transporter ATP-binding protein [Chloroflexota bacterium]
MQSRLLEIKGLTKQFGGLAAVKDLDFGVAENEMRAVIGPNGAGKSTLLRLIMGELRPTRGEVHFSTATAQMRIDGLRSHEVSQLGIAKAFQIPQIFPNLTVTQNIEASVSHGAASPWRKRTQRQQEQAHVGRVLTQVGLTEMAHVPAADLGHGNQKRLEIGMALGPTPQLLLLDEPTAGLSRTETDEIIHLIRSLQGSTTIIMVEHDMRVVMALADTITVLHFGQLLAEGTPDEIRNNPKVREVYLTQHALREV